MIAPRVPDLTNPGKFTGPSAQHAVRQARRLGENIVRSVRREPLVDYKHKYAGSVASLGLHKGVAHVYGVKVKGWPAWFMHRTYHMSRVPTFNRKARVVADWTLASLFKRDVVALGSLARPRQEFNEAAAPLDANDPGRLPGPGPAGRSDGGSGGVASAAGPTAAGAAESQS